MSDMLHTLCTLGILDSDAVPNSESRSKRRGGVGGVKKDAKIRLKIGVEEL